MKVMHFEHDINTILHAMWLGCTPLHWAALRGNVDACTVLVHAGSKQELLVKDKSGFTPAELASDKGQRHVAHILVCTDSVSCLLLWDSLLLLFFPPFLTSFNLLCSFMYAYVHAQTHIHTCIELDLSTLGRNQILHIHIDLQAIYVKFHADQVDILFKEP